MADARKARPLAALRTPGVKKQPTGPLTRADRQLWWDTLWYIQHRRDGWPIKKIASIAGVHIATVYRAIQRTQSIEEKLAQLS